MAGIIKNTFRLIKKGMIETRIECRADAGDNSFPDTVLSTKPPGTNFDIMGWKLYSVKAWPGATAPTDASDLAVTDSDGIDLLGGRGTDLLDATSKTSCAAGSVNTPMPMPITGPITLVLSGNSVASAIVHLKLLFVED